MTINTLIERLEAGETGQPVEMDALRVTGHNVLRLMRGAFPEYITEFNGVEVYRNEVSTSLDACRALHERVLPGWTWQLAQTSNPQRPAWAQVLKPSQREHGLKWERHSVKARTAAAAWLIAILKAVEAKGNGE